MARSMVRERNLAQKHEYCSIKERIIWLHMDIREALYNIMVVE